jgi:hypothetical protein
MFDETTMTQPRVLSPVNSIPCKYHFYLTTRLHKEKRSFISILKTHVTTLIHDLSLPKACLLTSFGNSSGFILLGEGVTCSSMLLACFVLNHNHH